MVRGYDTTQKVEAREALKPRGKWKCGGRRICFEKFQYNTPPQQAASRPRFLCYLELFGFIGNVGIPVPRPMLKSIRSITATMASKLSPRPVVAVVGTTGVGKSQLAVSLARSLKDTDDIGSAVILSADSMQLYKGLDVITNKVTEEEKGGVEHWGLDVVQPGEGGSWELGRWCKEAERKVSAC